MKLVIDEIDMRIPGNLLRHSSTIRHEGLACAYGALAQIFVGGVLAVLGALVYPGFYAGAVGALVYAIRFAWLARRCFRAVAPRWPR